MMVTRGAVVSAEKQVQHAVFKWDVCADDIKTTKRGPGRQQGKHLPGATWQICRSKQGLCGKTSCKQGSSLASIAEKYQIENRAAIIWARHRRGNGVIKGPWPESCTTGILERRW